MSNGAAPGEMPAGDPGRVLGGAGGATPPGTDQVVKGASAAGGEPTPETVEELRLELARLRKAVSNKADEAKRHYEAREALVKELADVDLGEVKAWKEEKAKSAEELARRTGEYEEMKAKLLKDRDSWKSKWESEVEDRRREKIANAILSVGADLGAVNARHLIAVYGSAFKIDDSGNVVHVSEIDDDGKLLTPAAFLEREKAGTGSHLFRTSMRSGSGSDGGGSAGGSGVVQISLGKLAGHEVLRLAEEARKAGRRVEYVD